jgi:hypothetical protein
VSASRKRNRAARPVRRSEIALLMNKGYARDRIAVQGNCGEPFA